MTVALHSTTGIEPIDDILRGLIGIVETSLPGRIRAYYLGGSYSDRTAVGHDKSPNSSDLDLYVIFRGTVAPDEAVRFRRLIEACRLLSPISLDATAYAEGDLLRAPLPASAQSSFLNVLIKVAALPLFGDDLRAALPEVPFTRYVLDVIESGVFHLAIPRERTALAYPLVTPLAPPLTYPDPDGEFYGYDGVPTRLDGPRGTRVLVDIAAWIATLILAVETGRYAARKSQSIQLCNEYLPNDERTRLAATIYDACKREWGYGLPERLADRAQLRGWCRDVLDVENDYLRLCRGYVLTQLQHGGDDEKRQSARILHSLVDADDEVLLALQALEQSTIEETQRAAAKALEIAANTRV